MADTFSGETGSDTLIAMQQQCTAIIKAGLRKSLTYALLDDTDYLVYFRSDSREDKGRHELRKLHQGDR
jgi:hypothetical protein